MREAEWPIGAASARLASRVSGSDELRSGREPPGLVRVSVLMLTYNHEKYIRQAIESVLMQQMTVAYELVVSDDCSQDSTAGIVREYACRHPGTIRASLRDTNIGMLRNFVDTLGACRGQYVALLDGDDYWTSSRKLQAQVDFLDSHPDCSMCFHPVRMRYEEEGRVHEAYYGPRSGKSVFTTEDILVWDFIPACSTIFRRGLFREFPEWFFSMDFGDWPLHIFNSQYGRIGYLDEVMAVYRINPRGAWHGLSRTRQLEAIVSLHERMNHHLGFRYDKLIRRLISQHCYRLAVLYARQRDWGPARARAARWVRERPLGFFRTPLSQLRSTLARWLTGAAAGRAQDP